VTLFGLALAKLAAIFGGFAAALVVLYILKLRRRRIEVPFARLWAQVAGHKESTALLKHLRRLVSLLLQLLFVALLVLAVGDPRLGITALSGRAVVLVVDASASMKATDGEPTRLDAAKREARKLARGLGGADQCMVVRMDGQPGPLTGFTGDGPALLRAIDGIAASDTPADLLGALRFAADALRGRQRPELIIIGDGAYPAEEVAAVAWQRDARAASGPASGPASAPASGPATAAGPLQVLAPVDLGGVAASFVPVGRSDDNVGIVAFNVRRYPRNKLSHEVFIEVQSFRSTPVTLQLELLADGGTIDLRPLTIPPGERVRQIYPDLPATGSRLQARLQPPPGVKGPLDSFPLDDTAFALLPERRRLKVLVVSQGNLFLEGALLALGGGGDESSLDYERVAPPAWTGPRADVDLTIFDGFTPRETPARGSYLYLNPQGPASPFPIRGEVARPYITELASGHPLTRWVTLSDTNIARASVFALKPGDVAVASSVRQPVIAARRAPGGKLLAVGFDLRRSDLPMRPAFPLLLANVLDWFSGDDAEFIATYKTGRTWQIPAEGAGDDVAIEPEGLPAERAPVHDGRAAYYGRRVGYYGLTLPRGRVLLAANLADPRESAIRPAAALTLGDRTLGRPAGFGVSLRRDLWLYLVLAALALTLVEWLTYNRRLTV
jgi:Ca-activated chloride channel homolog